MWVSLTLLLYLILLIILLKRIKEMKLKYKVFILIYNLVLGFGFLYFLENTFKVSQKIMAKQTSPLTITEQRVQDYKIRVLEPKIFPIKDSVLLDAPLIRQYPELPRGCEVTSLAMLLQFANVNVGKMQLAREIEKDQTPYTIKEGNIYWGDPNKGFLGDMYSFDNPGYGVYHKPIKNLANKYLPGQVVNLTGKSFQELKVYLSQDIPIWVITNTTFKKLPNSSFQTIVTPTGEKVNITYKEHSVLVTGYDQEYVYINEPIAGEKNKKVSLNEFVEAWEQMGSQAISYLPSNYQ
ncbi:C39 family peptidase [Bacillus carboniphilus]|uniref:C39 family peptidase n=1 Tax=Bacillus carboniphilus TaxID=86663 RepID=A0ABP3FZ38_9BACI